MKIEQFYYGPIEGAGIQFIQTPSVSQLLPEDILRDLYNLGKNTRKELKIVMLHQTKNGPILTISHIQPTQDDKKRATVKNKTFLIPLSEIVSGLMELLKPYMDNDFLDPLMPIIIGEENGVAEPITVSATK